jgi:Fe-S-cluster-containing dehydrogenase component
MGLYDPDRLNGVRKANDKSDWKAFDTALQAAFAQGAAGKKLALVSHSVVSPTQIEIINKLKAKFPSLNVISYELFSSQAAQNAVARVWGQAVLPQFELSKAKVIVALENDFLGAEQDVALVRQYAQSRNVAADKKLSKFYAVEGDYSATGANADVRVIITPAAIQDVLLSILGAVNAAKAGSVPSQIVALASLDIKAVAKKYNLDAHKLEALAHDLIHAEGSALVLPGPRLSEENQVLAHVLNKALGAEALISARFGQKLPLALSSESEISTFVAEVKSGAYAAVIHIDSNPVYHWNESLNYKEALSKTQSFTLTRVKSETSVASNWSAGINHPLESWGDASDRIGLYSIQQPLIEPLFNTRQADDILIQLAVGGDFVVGATQEILKTVFAQKIYGQTAQVESADKSWISTLHDGFILINNAPSLSFNSGVQVQKSLVTPDQITVILKPSFALGDGRLSNIGWLQELPHPVTKVTWDNYASVSPATLEKLKVQVYPLPGRHVNEYEIIQISLGGKTLEIPAFPQPGMAEDLVVIELGYARTQAGNIGTGVGYNAQTLLAAANIKTAANQIFVGAKVTGTGKKVLLATTQEQYPVDVSGLEKYQSTNPALAGMIAEAAQQRNIIREGTLAEYQANDDFLHHHDHAPIYAIDRPHTYTGVKWAMAIDLNKCTGCGECVVSCNVENNIPVVGKDQVVARRIMHWMRIDRYYSGASEDPKTSLQPMLCQHCDNAPCENVCPVVATAHSPEGLNDIAYNRCVGTRYCANNCPYKVRRFNYYNFRDHLADAHQEKPVFALLHNPEVTVRSRGVIEKCSFCVQRISASKALVKTKKQEWVGQGVETACQEACPTHAISFGNVNDVNTDVAIAKNHKLSYRVLEELAIKPNVHYIAKLRNAEGKAHS